jgi:hypothetical protein
VIITSTLEEIRPEKTATTESEFNPTRTITDNLTQATELAVETPTPTENPLNMVWQLEPVIPLGSLEGEGIWQPYIVNQDGIILAYRTLLQPDPERPYAWVAIVAFDLQKVRLHFILGYEEPYNPEGPERTGEMPESDKNPDLLLALFNGGFKATHGHFGAMSEGIEALPPRDGMGTIVIFRNGKVKIAIWGQDKIATDEILAYRQNGPLVIDNGEINPQIYNDSPNDWGYTVDSVSPTLRSGLGISEDGNTLYYYAGPSLSMETLAKGMQNSGAYRAIQLDINNFWVHYVTVINKNGQINLEPLLPELMTDRIDRYLYPHGRDFFYITLANNP